MQLTKLLPCLYPWCHRFGRSHFPQNVSIFAERIFLFGCWFTINANNQLQKLKRTWFILFIIDKLQQIIAPHKNTFQLNPTCKLQDISFAFYSKICHPRIPNNHCLIYIWFADSKGWKAHWQPLSHDVLVTLWGNVILRSKKDSEIAMLVSFALPAVVSLWIGMILVTIVVYTSGALLYNLFAKSRGHHMQSDALSRKQRRMCWNHRVTITINRLDITHMCTQ